MNRPSVSTVRTKRIADAIGRVRRARGLTQVELAEALGIGQSYLSLIERGRRRPSGELIAEMAERLGASSDELLGLAPRPPALPPRIARRVERILELPTRVQQQLLRAVDALLGDYGRGQAGGGTTRARGRQATGSRTKPAPGRRRTKRTSR